MEGLFLLLGHLVGDYIVQNDWMAANKTNSLPTSSPPKWPWRFGPPPIERPPCSVDADPFDRAAFAEALERRNAALKVADALEVDIKEKMSAYEAEMVGYRKELTVSRRGHLACLVHCLLYTFAVWLCSFWWMPWWGLAACFAVHFPVDRFRLASWWMKNVSGQAAFATGALAPWSIIVVDNTFHLLTLAAIAALAGRVTG